MTTPRIAGGEQPALPATADALLALIATEITPALTRLQGIAAHVEKAYRTNTSVRTGFAEQNAAEDGVASLLHFLDAAATQVARLRAAQRK